MATEIENLQFPFKEWETVFKMWRNNYEDYKDTRQLVISTHWASEGYWIEPKGKEINPVTDFVYKEDEVFLLEERVHTSVIGKPNYNEGLIL